MSSAIGGRSESIGSAPDRSISETTSKNKKKSLLTKKEQNQFENLTPQQINELIGNDRNSKLIPFGARKDNLFARSEFLTKLSNKFISAPSGANVDRNNAKNRITQLDETIANAKLAKTQNSSERNALENSGIKIFAGSPLDFAFSNKAKSLNNIIAQADSEKKGILLQTNTNKRKSFGNLFVNFRRSESGQTEDLLGTTGRQASIFAVLNEAKRTLSLPQFNGNRGSNTTLKSQIGALNQVQSQRLNAEQKSNSRLQVKQNFEKELFDIQNNGEINQKDKRNKILSAARKRDKALKTATTTNTQFEQSRAGFAASRTNIVSGATVRLIQDFIDLGRKKRNRDGN